MSSYFPSFNYLGFNSREKGLVVSHFDPDQGETDTFLGMEPIYTESADGSRRHDYGAKFTNVATFRITTIKPDGSDLSVAEIREHLKWLTGSRQNSPLELMEHFTEEITSDGTTKTFKLTNTCDRMFQVHANDTLLATNKWSYNKTTNTVTLTSAQKKGVTITISYGRIKYYFIGRITNAWQYKMDARTIGLIFEFTSTSPWAYSARQTVSDTVAGSKVITINNDSDDLYGYTPINVKFTDKETQLWTNTQTLPTGTGLDEWEASTSEINTYYNSDNGFWRIHLKCEDSTPDKTDDNKDIWYYFRSPLVKLPSNWQDRQVTLSALVNSLDWAGMDAGGSGPITWSLCLSQGTDTRGYYGSKYNLIKPGVVEWGADAHYNYPLVNSAWREVWTTFTLNKQGMHYTNATPPDYAFEECTHMFVQFFLRRYGDYRIMKPKLEWGNTYTPWGGASGELGRALKITNGATKETTSITNIVANETISMTDNMMISSNNTSKVFGDTFNFVFPRLVAGENKLTIQGAGNITFDYVHAIKIGDCAIDINATSEAIYDDENHIQIGTLPWNRVSDTPTTLQGYGITDAYSKTEINNILKSELSKFYTKSEVDALIMSIEIDENKLSKMLAEELN